MKRGIILILGILATWIMAYFVLTGIPSIQFVDIPPSPGVTDYNESTARGRKIYVSEGCIYCHSQQVRPEGYGGDFARGWGRASEPSDYVFDQPHQLGTMRTGPDLHNIAIRQPSQDWHLAHLYNPRSVMSESLMPPYPWLFEEKAKAEPGDVVVPLSGAFKPEGKVVVAKQEALDLFNYLMKLQHQDITK